MFPCLKLKKIEERLQCISDFENPKILLEQYVTPWHLGSQMLYMIQVYCRLFVCFLEVCKTPFFDEFILFYKYLFLNLTAHYSYF